MLVLGVESSCDETGAALVDETGRVVCDVVHSQVATHALYGGVVPELASRDHLRSIGPVVREALAQGAVTLAEVDGIAVTNRPGLVGALLVGVQAAKGLAWAAGKPLVGVDHLLGHVLAVFLRRGGTSAVAGPSAGAAASATEADPATPRFPFVCLLVSGGHTAIYRVDAPRPDAITELGATRDDAAGEAFDKVAKLLGLGYPGGPAIDRLAPSGDPTRVTLSAPMTARGSLQMSFSGIKTQVAQLVAREGPVTGQRTADICAAFQTAVTSSLANKAIDAAVHEGVEEVVLGGGVAANRELRRRTSELGASRGIRVLVPPLASCTDNAAMIAYAGALRLARGERDAWDLVATSETALPRETRKGRGKR
jgi:N6-L-threonylcarbamoyladenine synthase